ncbi:MAG: hypothetical protein NT062_13415, partial [Proteobacteria bacterium]|nr:hypothetical protein [Pseudomonadota bacterium]
GGELAVALGDPAGALASKDPMTVEARAASELAIGTEPAIQHGLATLRAALGDGHPALGPFVDALAHLPNCDPFASREGCRSR